MHLGQESDSSRHSNGKDGGESFAGCNLVLRKGSVAVSEELDE
jgi:hypothetical protein